MAEGREGGVLGIFGKVEGGRGSTLDCEFLLEVEVKSGGGTDVARIVFPRQLDREARLPRLLWISSSVYCSNLTTFQSMHAHFPMVVELHRIAQQAQWSSRSSQMLEWQSHVPKRKRAL